MSITTTVTIAQALASGASNLHVLDTAADIAAALPNAGLVARVSLFTLSANATIAAAAAEKLAGLGAKLQLNGEHITIRDTLAGIDSAANAAGVALASTRVVADAAYNLLNAAGGAFAHVNSVVLLGAPTLNVAQYARLQALPGFSVDPSAHLTLTDSLTNISALIAAHPAWLLPVTSLAIELDGSHIGAFTAAQIVALEGHGTSVAFVANGASTTLPITAAAHDLAANAAVLNHLAGQVGLSFTLSNEGATISAADAAALSGLADFNPASHTLYVADTGAAISADQAALFGHGYAGVTVTSGTLAGSIATLLSPVLHFAAGANARLAGNAQISVAQAAGLAALAHFSTGAAQITVLGTAAAIAGQEAAIAAVATLAEVTDSGPVTAAQADALALLSAAQKLAFQGGGQLGVADSYAALVAAGNAAGVALAAHLTVVDTAANLVLASIHGWGNVAPSYVLSGAATVSAAQAGILGGLGPFFSTGGFGFVASDTAANLLAMPAPALALLTGEILSASATISAANLTTLAARTGFALGGGVVLTVLDSAAALLGLSPAAAAEPAVFLLNANATVDAAQFVTLRDTLHAGLNGHMLTVADSAADLLALAGGNLSLASVCALSAAANVSAAQAVTLAGEPGFTTGGFALTITDTAAALLALPAPVAALATSLVLGDAETVSAAQLTALAAFGAAFSAGTNTITVEDSAAALAALSPAALALAGAEVLQGPATVTVATAAALLAETNFHFSHAGGATLTLQDTAANLLAAPAPVLAAAAGIQLSADATVTAAQFVTLRDTLHIALNTHVLTIADNAANLLVLAGEDLSLAGACVLTGDATVSAAQARVLAAEPGFATGGHMLTISDTAAALVALPAGVAALAAHLSLSGVATVSAAQLTGLAAFGGAFTAAGHAITVADTAAALAALSGPALALASGEVVDQSGIVSAAALTALAALPGLVLAQGAALTVQDSAANLLALSGPALALAGAVQLGADATVTAAQFATLRDTLDLGLNGHSLTVADSAAALLGLTGSLALGSAFVLNADAAVSVAQAVALAAEPGFSVGGHVLTVTGTAASLLALPLAVLGVAGVLALPASEVVTAAQLTGLAGLGATFSAAGHTITVSDSAAALAGLGEGAVALAAGEVVDASASISAGVAAALVALPNVSLADGVALTVLDSATALLGLPPLGALASAFDLNASATVNAQQFSGLRTLGVALNGHTLTVSDSAANLLALSGGNLSLAAACVLSGGAQVTAAQAALLVAEPGFSTGGYTLIVTGTVATLTSLSNAVLAAAGGFLVTAPATLMAAGVAALAALPDVSVATGVVVTVQDTAAALLGLTVAQRALAGAYQLSASATVNAGQFDTLRDTLHVTLNGNTLTISDNAANLLAQAAGNLSLASACVLSGNATVSAAQAATLAGEPGFSVGGHVLTVSDAAAALLALAPSVQALAGSLLLAASQTVSAAQLTALAGLGGFGLGGHALTVADSATNLLALGAPALDLASGEVLAATASVNAVQATSLAALPAFSLGQGVSLTVVDTAAALLALSGAVTAVATGYGLSANATVGVADFETLRDTLHVAADGHVLTIAGTASDLLGLAGSNLSLAGACVLTANATVDAAQATALAGEPGFSAGGHTLTVADSAADLLALPASVLAVAGVLELNSNQMVGTAALASLAALGGQFTADGYTLAVSGTAAQLTALSAPALALATTEVVTQSATLSAAGAATLAALGSVTLAGGVTLTVDDTATALLALSNAVTGLATGYELSANATVDAPQFGALRTLGIGLNGHVLTVADTAAELLTLAGGNLSLASACVLTANATVSVANALALAGEPGFSAGGYVLTISGSAASVTANLAALTADLSGLEPHLVITLTGNPTTVTVGAAAYTANSVVLDAIAGGGGAVIVADSAANVAAASVAMAADAQVGHVSVTDSATDVVENLAGLLPLGSKLAVTLTDEIPLAASLVPYLVQLASVTTSVGVSDTASQIAAVVEQADASGNAAATAFLEANGAAVSAPGSVQVADLSALEQLGNSLNRNGHAIYVYDTVSHLTAAGAAAALTAATGSGLISGIYIKTTGGVLTVSAATALALFNTDGASVANPPPQGGSIAVTVADSAANIAANSAALALLVSSSDVAHVQVNASATISDTVLGTLQSLGAVAGGGVALTVSDAGATIAQNASAQATGQSIEPSAWVLSGNSTVTEAQAATLGALSHFSTGGYTLTLTLQANTAISVADANAIGTLAGALNLNGYALTVAGTVAQLSLLSAAALGVAVPELTDTLANISGLTIASPLLAGTVTVSDAETLTAAQAQGFLSLIASGQGPGINVQTLGFGGHTESVIGSVAQLQALTASTAWSNTTPAHGAFALTAQDTVAALTNAANLSFLEGLHATSLSANSIVNAATAETLAGLQAHINFGLGGYTLTVQDSAANLLAAQNAAGVALASALVMSGPATLDATDAETLLSLSHLSLNATLTVEDSASNLLNGALLSAITASGDAAHVQILLNGPATLDADTAAELVALPGFADTQNLSIADSSAYLLASANLSAEQQAVSVTLAGDETVSANTVLRLSEVPHFNVGDNHLTLASNDFADEPTLKAIADLGANFSDGGHTITATADALDLTPTEYANLQNDGIVANGHAISAVLVNDSVTDMNNIMALTATGVAGATVNVYDAGGNLLSTTHEAQAGFTVTAADGGTGQAFAITETVNGVESAPVVVLEANVLETAIAAADTNFASSGAIEVDSGKYLNLYASTNVPQNLQVPALVYNAATHTISLDIPNAAAITLITLGASTHPASLDVSEILVKHHG